MPNDSPVQTQQEAVNRLRSFAFFTVKLLHSQVSERQKQGGPDNERMAGEFQSVLDILCQELSGKCDLEVVLPQPGDLFDARLHAALGQEDRQGLAPGRVVRVVSPGFRCGNKVTYAQVIVSR